MTELFPWLKTLHVTTVVITGVLFLMRYRWMLQGRLALQGCWVPVLPHVNDAILLFSGLAMARLIGQYPLVDGWLSAKLVGLLCWQHRPQARPQPAAAALVRGLRHRLLSLHRQQRHQPLPPSPPHTCSSRSFPRSELSRKSH